MTPAQRELLNYIRSSLWADTARTHIPDEVMEEARRQAIVPLVAFGSMEASQYMVHYMRILYAQDGLVALFRDVGLPVAILKGAAAAVYYPEPILRTMGDVDLIVPQGVFEAAQSLMERSGYKRETDEHDKPDTRHTAYTIEGVTFELHHHFSSEGIDVEKYVIRGLESPVTAELSGHIFPMLPPLENGMVLLAHLAQHLRDGVGLRQMIDWMMYVHAVLDDDFWESQFREAAVDCGLQTLAFVSTRLCQKYLGLPDRPAWCAEADERLVDQLLENLLVAGNFGHSHGSGSSVETVATNIKRIGLFRYLQQQGERNWSAYRKHRFLRPFCWIYQILRYIRRGFATRRSGSQLAQDYRRSRSRYELLTRLGID